MTKENPSEESITNFDNIEDEATRIDAICLFCDQNRNALPKESLQLSQKAYQLAQKIGYQKGEASCLKGLGYQHWHLSEIALARQELLASRNIMANINYYYEWGEVCMIEAMIMWSQGDYELAMNYVLDNIRLLDERQETHAQVWLYWALGVYNYDLKNYDKSLKYYSQALEICRVMQRYNADLEGWTLLGLGTVYRAKEEQSKALEYLEEAKRFSKKYNQWMQAARIHFELGNLKLSQQKLDEAKAAYLESYEMRKSYQLKPAMVSSLLSLAEVKTQQEYYQEALLDVQEALEIASEINTRAKIYQCHQKLAQLYELLADYQQAYHHIQLFYQIKSGVVSEETNKKLNVLEANFAAEKAEQEKEIHRLKNVELKIAHNDIIKKNKEMMASITYAQRIQKAMLPPLQEIQAMFPASFVLFKPRNIVSGDFYWFKKVGNQTFLAAVDCTGHGIPGAFMSMLGYSLLNEIVNEQQIPKPGEVLDQLHRQIRKVLRQDQTRNRDGMDVCLCSFTRGQEYATLQFAGAKRSLYYVENQQFKEMKGNRQNIGGFEGLSYTKFSTIETKIYPEAMLYLTTDGYSDTPNFKRKSFGQERFKRLLQEIATEPIRDQKQRLEETLSNFQQNIEQRDDILVIGIKL
ncbi:MAG TPA: hypothetical protein DCS93_23215 [Microscillaceae bacterium]|nr:hypothetical protein [Microscillaceae bacterium]